MKNLQLIYFSLLLFCFNNLHSQDISEINAKTLHTVNDIISTINLNKRDYGEVYQTYSEYGSKLAAITINQDNTGKMYGNKNKLRIISLEKVIKSKTNSRKFDIYLTYTRQSDLTKNVYPIKKDSVVNLNGDNANPNPPITNTLAVTLYEN